MNTASARFDKSDSEDGDGDDYEDEDEAAAAFKLNEIKNRNSPFTENAAI